MDIITVNEFGLLAFIFAITAFNTYWWSVNEKRIGVLLDECNSHHIKKRELFSIKKLEESLNSFSDFIIKSMIIENGEAIDNTKLNAYIFDTFLAFKETEQYKVSITVFGEKFLDDICISRITILYKKSFETTNEGE